MIEALIDPWPPFTFCCPQAIVDQDAGVSIPNSSPFSRSTRFPFTSTASPPAPLAIRKAPSASVESIQPRPPRPCEVGRPKGRRRKNRRQSHNFFLAPAAPGHPNSPPRPGRLPTPPPLPENLLSDCTENCPLRPCEHPGGFGIRKSASNSGHSPLRGLGGGLGGGLGDASPARRGSRSRPPLRRPRPLRFARLRVPVWNPYSRGRLSPAKSEDRKGGEGKTDANLTHFF